MPFATTIAQQFRENVQQITSYVRFNSLEDFNIFYSAVLQTFASEAVTGEAKTADVTRYAKPIADLKALFDGFDLYAKDSVFKVNQVQLGDDADAPWIDIPLFSTQEELDAKKEQREAKIDSNVKLDKAKAEYLQLIKEEILVRVSEMQKWNDAQKQQHIDKQNQKLKQDLIAQKKREQQLQRAEDEKSKLSERKGSGIKGEMTAFTVEEGQFVSQFRESDDAYLYECAVSNPQFTLLILRAPDLVTRLINYTNSDATRRTNFIHFLEESVLISNIKGKFEYTVPFSKEKSLVYFSLHPTLTEQLLKQPELRTILLSRLSISEISTMNSYTFDVILGDVELRKMLLPEPKPDFRPIEKTALIASNRATLITIASSHHLSAQTIIEDKDLNGMFLSGNLEENKKTVFTLMLQSPQHEHLFLSNEACVELIAQLAADGNRKRLFVDMAMKESYQC